MKHITTLIIISVTLSFISCKKEKIPILSLPPITETGQNTLGFLLDSKVWTNYGRRCTFAGCNDNKVVAYLYKQPNGDFDLGISADYTVTSETIDQSFFFYTKNVTTTGTFYLDSNLNRGMTYIASRYNQWYKEYKNKIPNTCILTITKFDTTSKIISGKFSGTLYNPLNSKDSVKIVDGRFDSQLDYRR